MISLAASAERWARARTSDAEAPARVAGPRGFHPGVQRQEVRLEGDLVDDPDDLADLAGRTLDAAHGLDGLAHHGAGGFRIGLRGADDVAGVAGALARLAHRGGDFVERRGGLLQARGLLLGATGKVVRRRRDLARARADRGGVGGHHRERVGELGHGAVEIGAQLVVFGREAAVDPEREGAPGELVEPTADAIDHVGELPGGFGPGRFVAPTLRLALDAGGFGLAFQRRLLDRRLLEALDGIGHVADLVLLADRRDRDGGVAGRETAHRVRHRRERAADLHPYQDQSRRDGAGEAAQAGQQHGQHGVLGDGVDLVPRLVHVVDLLVDQRVHVGVDLGVDLGQRPLQGILGFGPLAGLLQLVALGLGDLVTVDAGHDGPVEGHVALIQDGFHV